MRIYFFLLLASVLALLGSACTAQQPPAPPQPEFRPTATIKDIMDSMVDPSADAVWDSVASIVTIKGIEEKAPHTDEEWTEVRRKAITLMEATNLLLVPNRRVARPGEKSENPQVELQPEEMETLMSQDRATWTKLVHGLNDKAALALQAIEAKDTEALLMSGDGIDSACERCHLTYWYPKDEAAKKDFELQESLKAGEKSR